MHKRPNVHAYGPKGIPRVHNLHIHGTQSAFSGLSGMHNPHIPDAQRAPHTCKTCTRTTLRPGIPHRAGRRQDSHLPTDIEERTFPTRDDPEKTGGHLAAAPSRVQLGLAARLPAKGTSGQQRAGRLTVQSFRVTPRLLKRTRSFGPVFANEQSDLSPRSGGRLRRALTRGFLGS